MHTCHAIECETEVPPEMFMCKKHWFSLPKKLRDNIWETYRPRQCDDWKPSKVYCEAAKNCVIFVARKEKRLFNMDNPKIVLYDIFGV